ncbi:hypothetical protein IAG25_40185 [Caballeronia sp. EK]|uniref:hypothetical protein n=1 Tax=Caballeronia sp. EK TaxID=2767469 RepID=UPI0016562790|nr:hypothetical protein [Caballeronia sp. EK]MBC8642975.1 hypothetical protein [Caballeronia sp. EK]
MKQRNKEGLAAIALMVRNVYGVHFGLNLAVQAMARTQPDPELVAAILRDAAERTLEIEDNEPYPEAFRDGMLTVVNGVLNALKRGGQE